MRRQWEHDNPRSLKLAIDLASAAPFSPKSKSIVDTLDTGYCASIEKNVETSHQISHESSRPLLDLISNNIVSEVPNVGA